jgi:short-subunit dehydrogenase
VTIFEWAKENFDLKRDVALITGGSSGIGKECLRMLSEKGIPCVIASENSEELEKTAKEIGGATGVEVSTILCDLATLSGIDKLIEESKKYSVRILFNNAGFGLKGNFLDISREKYVAIMSVNALAPTLLTYEILPRMIDDGKGVVVQVATVNVASPIPKNTVYTASKAYVWSYANSLAKEYEDTNILFQILLPGTTDTPFHQKQGAVPKSMTMTPKMVAEASLAKIDRRVVIPNRIDRILFPIFTRLPMQMRMGLSSYLLKKRLGV